MQVPEGLSRCYPYYLNPSAPHQDKQLCKSLLDNEGSQCIAVPVIQVLKGIEVWSAYLDKETPLI